MDDGGTTRGGGVGVASGDEEAGADAEAVGAKPESFSPTSVSMSAACSARSALSLETEDLQPCGWL